MPSNNVADPPIPAQIAGTTERLQRRVLLSAVRYLKDNRLLPRGFDKATADPEIDVFGAAATDDTFSGGSDRAQYRIALTPERHAARVEVALRYQPIGYRWAHNLEGYKSAETDRFLSFFRSMEAGTSTLVATVSRGFSPDTTQ